jgi:site-specific DNA-methyltransferase (adenine-specific)
MGTFYQGDNLLVLKSMLESGPPAIDMIYIDPPFNTNRKYKMPSKRLDGYGATPSSEHVDAFSDKWCGDSAKRELESLSQLDNPAPYRFLIGSKGIIPNRQLGYLSMMAHRLYYIHATLKDGGNFYLHCDPTSGHYLKILLDTLFGGKNFRNEIVWCYSRPSAPGQKQLSRVHDTILWYSKGDGWCFNPVRQPYASAALHRSKFASHTSKMAGSSGHILLHEDGKFPEDWIYISPVKGNSGESTGFPTQKPEALLELLIKSGSNEGDVVADFFGGCGTTAVVAERLKREWIIADSSPVAVWTAQRRLERGQ